ncbi:glycosyl hydrolase family 28 protein [Kiritimatiellaeota bacterium B1221]|nr:glycosyl hydrolase family 28 protein [Kiritimatiellaeota bacterium B1221]
MITTFAHPRICNFAHHIQLKIEGQVVEVLHTEAADFANFIYDPADGPVLVEVSYTDRVLVDQVDIRPRTRNHKADIQAASFSFTLDKPEKLSLEVPGRPPLFFWANPPEKDRPDPEDPHVLYFKAGQVYEVGECQLEDGQTLYIEGGAMVRGKVRAKNAAHITIRGHGILDGGFYYPSKTEATHLARFHRCQNVIVRDITMIQPSGWMLVPVDCDEVEIFNLKQIGEVVSSDGIDVVGSRKVHIHDCFLRNNDDCVVIKAFVIGIQNKNRIPCDGRGNVAEVLVENCIFLNAPAGNAMEIGHELNVEYVRDVTFRNIDVLSVHGQGAVFSIHNYAQALVENITFEDIRIEHCYDKLIDFRISRSRFSVGEITGRIRNVTLRNIQWFQAPNNIGYTISLIGGWSPEADIQNITIENFCINGHPIESLDELEITTRHTRGLRLI